MVTRPTRQGDLRWAPNVTGEILNAAPKDRTRAACVIGEHYRVAIKAGSSSVSYTTYHYYTFSSQHQQQYTCI